jgi:branched-chain amino acid aminotransferase
MNEATLENVEKGTIDVINGSTNGVIQSNGVGYMDGNYMPRERLALPMTDIGFKLCDMTYDAIHVRKGAFFRLDDHLDRFALSIEKRRFNFAPSRQDVSDVLHQCVRQSGLRDSMTMLIATRGDQQGPTLDLRNCKSRFIAWAAPYYRIVTEREMTQGVEVAISSVPRVAPDSIDPTVKNFARIDFADALFDVYDRGCKHAILLDREGFVTEGRGWNLFALFGGVLVTPDGGVLEGITRRTVLALCEQSNVTPKVAKLSAAQLLDADEVFMASTAGGIMPIRKIDDQVIGDGPPGPVTQRLHDAYWALHDEAEYSSVVTYDA